MMSPERRAMYRIREEANKLGLACGALAGTSALMHLAYDAPPVITRLPVDQSLLLGRLRKVK